MMKFWIYYLYFVFIWINSSLTLIWLMSYLVGALDLLITNLISNLAMEIVRNKHSHTDHDLGSLAEVRTTMASHIHISLCKYWPKLRCCAVELIIWDLCCINTVNVLHSILLDILCCIQCHYMTLPSTFCERSLLQMTRNIITLKLTSN